MRFAFGVYGGVVVEDEVGGGCCEEADVGRERLGGERVVGIKDFNVAATGGGERGIDA